MFPVPGTRCSSPAPLLSETCRWMSRPANARRYAAAGSANRSRWRLACPTSMQIPRQLPGPSLPSAGKASVTACSTSIAPFSSASLTERSPAYDRMPAISSSSQVPMVRRMHASHVPDSSPSERGCTTRGPPREMRRGRFLPGSSRGRTGERTREWRLTAGGSAAGVQQGGPAAALEELRLRGPVEPQLDAEPPGGRLLERGEEPGLGAEGLQPVPGAEAAGHGGHPLSVVVVREEMNCRRAAMKAARRGAMMTTEAAMTMFHRVPASTSAK